jgi:hypothetical protein
MGYRSFYFVCRHTVVRNYGSALMSQHRLAVDLISFEAPFRPIVNSNSFDASSDLV